jgi:hypothetical protein
MGPFAVSTRICGSIVLILPVLATPSCAGQCETNGSCYITPVGAGAKTGVDWNNAYDDLPSSLTRGVMWDSTIAQRGISNSGASGNPHYYGVNQTWYTGGSWTRPIFGSPYPSQPQTHPNPRHLYWDVDALRHPW